MTDEMKHTPTPWKIIDGNTLASLDGKSLIGIARSDIDPFQAESDEANAEFIIRACNAYEDLLAAMNEIYMGLHPNVGGPTITREMILRIAGTAIAKAMGK